jgi:hypothetical protein
MELIIERGKVWKLEELPPFSIAIDGAVAGPIIDTANNRYSFDHHAGCLRFCTQASCQQTLTALLLGLNPENYTIYLNDCDTDCCLSVWLLQNPYRIKEPLVIKLVNAVGIVDAHAGAICANGMSKTVEWISCCEVDFKRDSSYENITKSNLKYILEATLRRIEQYVDGEAAIEISKQEKHDDYKILRNENGYIVIQSDNSHIYSTLYSSGFDRVVLVRPLDNGSLAVSLAKRSDFIDNFDLNKMYEKLNEIEVGWGGGSSIGGAPRNSDGTRSKLPLEKILEVIDSTLVRKSTIPPIQLFV